MDLHKIKELMVKLMQDRYQHPDRGLGDAFLHCERVAKLAVDLRKHILPNDDSRDEILTVAGWFHDIGKGSPEHARFGAVMAREVLHDFCSSNELDEICEIIRLHADRGHSEYSPWVKLHQDADVLDHHGTYFIWYVFSHRSWRHEGDIAKIAKEQLEVYNYKAKILESVNYDFSRSICAEKFDYQNAFWERLKIEASRGIPCQAVLVGGLPFELKQPRFNTETEAAIREARDIRVGKVQSKIYHSVAEMNADLDADPDEE
ncbi:MAG: HD domain-containing protein [Clostridium sp.]|jgi:hypothetical protein|nr:HD domain-containing protein [Clostridium sp.]